MSTQLLLSTITLLASGFETVALPQPADLPETAQAAAAQSDAATIAAATLVEEPIPLPEANTSPAPPPAPPVAAQVCHPIHVVREKITHSAKRMYRCYGPPLQQTLCVDNPADCQDCLYAVPVCVPACCTGIPECCNQRTGLLGRGYVTYRWPCGFQVEIAFRVHGGVILLYR